MGPTNNSTHLLSLHYVHNAYTAARACAGCGGQLCFSRYDDVSRMRSNFSSPDATSKIINFVESGLSVRFGRYTKFDLPGASAA